MGISLFLQKKEHGEDIVTRAADRLPIDDNEPHNVNGGLSLTDLFKKKEEKKAVRFCTVCRKETEVGALPINTDSPTPDYECKNCHTILY